MQAGHLLSVEFGRYEQRQEAREDRIAGDRDDHLDDEHEGYMTELYRVDHVAHEVADRVGRAGLFEFEEELVHDAEQDDGADVVPLTENVVDHDVAHRVQFDREGDVEGETTVVGILDQDRYQPAGDYSEEDGEEVEDPEMAGGSLGRWDVHPAVLTADPMSPVEGPAVITEIIEHLNCSAV